MWKTSHHTSLDRSPAALSEPISKSESGSMPPVAPAPQCEDENMLNRGVRPAVTVAVGAETRAALDMSRAGVLWGGCPRIPGGEPSCLSRSSTVTSSPQKAQLGAHVSLTPVPAPADAL